MAVIGFLGDILFQASEKTVLALDNMKWSGSAQYAVHQRHGCHALTEYTGLDPDQISFDMVLTEEYGYKPREELRTLWEYERSGAAVPLTLGRHGYGKYRWSVVSHDLTVKNTDRQGNIISAVVAVKLQEYLRD